MKGGYGILSGIQDCICLSITLEPAFVYITEMHLSRLAIEVMEKCYLEQEYPEWQLHLELKLFGWVCAGVEAVSNSSCGSKQCGF